MADGTVSLTLPRQSLAAVALESNVSANSVGALFARRPMQTMSGLQIVTLTKPMQTMVAVGVQGTSGAVALKKPLGALLSSGFVTIEGTVTCERPFQSLVSYGPNTTLLVRPMAALAAVGTTGNVGIATVRRSIVSLVATGSNSTIATGTALTRPMGILQVVGTTGVTSNVAASLRMQILAAQGVTGTVGTALLTVPLLQLDASGTGPLIGSVTVQLPIAHLQIVGTTGFSTQYTPDGVEVPAIVMNTQTMGLSHYTNYNFNSFAQFNGVFLAANSTGLFVLAGNDDAGVNIDAQARTGITDFGTSYLKRIDRCYAGYRTDGDLVLRVWTNELSQRDYSLQRSDSGYGLHGNHLRIGRGIQARYWQFEVRNNNGSDFSLNMIEVKPTKLRRRVGGSDA